MVGTTMAPVEDNIASWPADYPELTLGGFAFFLIRVDEAHRRLFASLPRGHPLSSPLWGYAIYALRAMSSACK